jgi:hypothetical protein
MFRLLALVVVVASSGCTLLLATDKIIAPCKSQEDCDNVGEGLVCEENACLPEDDPAAGASG